MNKHVTSLIFLMGLGVVAPFNTYGQSEEEIFEKAFGRKPQEKRMSLPVFVGKDSIGEVSFYIRSEKIKSFNGERMRIALSEFFNEDLINQIPDQDKVDFKVFPSDIKVKLFLDSLYVSLEVPAKYYKTNKSTLSYGPNLSGKKIYYPEDYSHILNYWYNYKNLNKSNEQHILDLDSAFYIKGYVLENDFEWENKDGNKNFRRKKTTLIKDFIESENRLQAGDINFRTTNLQNQLTLLGVSFSKDYSLNPYKKIKPVNQFEFILDQRSYVTVYINDRPVRSEILDKGKHSIQDLVLDYGRNNIKIVAKEVAGDTKEFTYSWAGANELLRKGLSLYGHNLGVKSDQGDRIEYEGFESLTYSGFYQYGLSSIFTLGGQLQANDDSILFGPTLFTATDVGIIKTESAISKDRVSQKDGFALDLEIEDSYNTKMGEVRGALAYEYRSPFYSEFDTIALNQKFLNTFRFDISWYMNRWMSISGDINRSIARREGLVDRELYGVGLSLRPTRNFRITSNYNARKSETGLWSHEVNIFLNYSLADSGHYVNTFHDTENHKHTAQLSYSPKKKQDAFYYRVLAEKEPTLKATTATGGYKSRYFDSEVSAKVTDNRKNDYYARLRGAVVMTPNFVTMSPSVYNGFSFIRGKNSLEGKKVGLLNDVGGVGSKEFREMIFLPQLTSYHYYRVYMDPTHLENGTSFDYEEFYLYPSYKSVVKVELGQIKSYVVFGKFKGKDLTLKTGELISADNTVIPFFTNRKGKFVIESVKSGTYELWINGKRHSSGISITDNADIFVNLGTLN